MYLHMYMCSHYPKQLHCKSVLNRISLWNSVMSGGRLSYWEFCLVTVGDWDCYLK